MLSGRFRSAVFALVLASATLGVAGAGAPAAAANSVTCNGAYTSSGPMGSFTYQFEADVRVFMGPDRDRDVKMVMTYTGVDGYAVQVTHHQVNGFIRFTDSETAPGFVEGVTITDQTYINDEPQGALYNHPSCQTYAEEPPPPPSPTPPSAPLIGTASSGAVGGTTTATARWYAPRSTGGRAISGYRVKALKLNRDNRVVATRTSSLRPASARTFVWSLAAGRYRFRVVAYNAVGRSPYSAMSNIVRSR